MKATGRCAFCARSGSSEEDVFAKWIADVVAGDGPFTLLRSRGRNKTDLRYLGIVSRAPCRKCNNEWMSQFEESAKPLLTPIIQGRPARWESVEHRTIVARWALKTALMLDRSGVPEDWTAEEKDFRYLFARQEPPASVTIHLGRYVPNPGEDFFAVWANSSWTASADRLPDGTRYDGYRIAFSVGHALFQVYGLVGADRDDFVVERPVFINGRPIADVFRQLWPLASVPHDWPPLGAKFSTSGLSYLKGDPHRVRMAADSPDALGREAPA